VSIIRRIVSDCRLNPDRVRGQAGQSKRRIIAIAVGGVIAGGNPGQLGGQSAAGRIVSIIFFLNDIVVSIRERGLVWMIHNVTADGRVVGIVISRVRDVGIRERKTADVGRIEIIYLTIGNFIGQIAGGQVVSELRRGTPVG